LLQPFQGRNKSSKNHVNAYCKKLSVLVSVVHQSLDVVTTGVTSGCLNIPYNLAANKKWQYFIMLGLQNFGLEHYFLR